MLAKCSSRGLRRQKGGRKENIDTALPLQARNQMLRGMDWWTFERADSSVASTWFGLRHARLQSCSPSTYSGFEIWVLRFRGLGASFSRLGCSVLETWVLRFRVMGAPFSRFGCFVLRSSFSSASFSKLPLTSLPLSDLSRKIEGPLLAG